jgi:hypothetical protein
VTGTGLEFRPGTVVPSKPPKSKPATAKEVL